MKGAYERMIPTIQNRDMKVKPIFALCSYLLMVLGLIIFVNPNVTDTKLQTSLLYGGMFGLVVYGVYDFTIAAVLTNWNISIAILDILWGIFVYSAAAYIGSMYIKRAIPANSAISTI